jgi:hypothetical protein
MSPCARAAELTLALDALKCSDWLASGSDNVFNVAIWLDGLLTSDQSGRARLNLGRVYDSTERLRSACAASPQKTVLEAKMESAEAASFGCDAEDGHWCGFVVFRASGLAAQSLKLFSGQKILLRDVQYPSDSYCICIDAVPASNLQLCLPNAQRWCKRAAVTARYNN